MDTFFIFVISFFGMPAVVFVGWSMIAMSENAPALLRANPARSALGFLLVLLGVLMALPYVVVFLGEVYTQATCAGAACAQGGLGLLIFTPLPWISCLLAYGAMKLTIYRYQNT